MVSMFTPVSPESVPIVIPSAREAVILSITNFLDPVVATACSFSAMMVKERHGAPQSRRSTIVLVAGGLAGALVASSCCMLPLVLFSLGVSGAWISHLTQLAPYQHCFVV